MSKSLRESKYITFDVVGTPIELEGGLKASLAEIAAETGMTFHGERALSLYCEAAYPDDVDFFPDDLVPVNLAIAPKLRRPGRSHLCEQRRKLRHAQKACNDTIEPAEFIAADDRFTPMADLAEAVAASRD